MKRIAAFTLLFAGLLILLVSLIYYGGNALPYPDPTTELLPYQADQARKWGLLVILGLVASGTGLVWLWRQSRAEKRQKESTR